MKRVFIPLIILAIISSCNILDDGYSGSLSDDREFASEVWKEVTANVFPVPIGPEYDHKDRVFPAEGTFYCAHSKSGESAGICFESVIEPAREYPDKSGFDGCGHVVDLSIVDIPIKVSKKGEIKFSKKTQRGTISFARWEECSVLYDIKIKNCKVSISGTIFPLETRGALLVSQNNAQACDVTIKIISPDKVRWCLHFDKLVYTNCDSGFLEFYQ